MRTPTPVRILGLLGAIALTAASAHGAQRLRPPVEELTRGDNRIAVVLAVSRTEPERMLFRRVQELVRETPEEITLRADAAVLDAIEIQKSYIVAFSYVRRNPLFRDVIELDPDGPAIKTAPVVGAAVFEDTPDLRALFGGGADAEGDQPRETLTRLLRLMQRQAPGTRRVAIAELYLRRDLHALVTRTDLDPIQEALEREALEPMLRDFLLQTAQRLSSDLPVGWLAREAREVVASADTRLELASMVPALVQTALRVLRETGGRNDAELVSRHLGSNSPGVVKVALETLDALDSVAARREAERTLERDELHDAARRALEAYLQRGREPAAGT